MARFTFNEQSPGGAGSAAHSIEIMTVVVRAVGVVLLVIGLWVAVLVIAQAWGLYSDPQRIERLAKAIEAGSNLDSALVARRPAPEPEPALSPNSFLPLGGPAAPAEEEAAPLPPFRLSYFVAWIIAMLLLLLIGRLSMSAIKTGGELALYDMQLHAFARALLRETREEHASRARASAPTARGAGTS
jgi:hypothetical protein